MIYPESYQTNLDALKSVAIRSSSGGIVYLGDIARFESTPTSPLITRTDRNNVIHVNANYAPNSSLSAVENGLIKRLPSLHLPPNIVVRPAPLGQQDFMHQTLVGMGLSMIVSVILVYLLMVALYNSYVSPFIIIFSVPVAAIGAIGALVAHAPHAQPLLADRHDSADRHRDEERDSARWTTPTRCARAGSTSSRRSRRARTRDSGRSS